MTTKAIGIKEFRNNINSLWKQACEKQIRYVVLRHSVPIWEVKPIDENALILEKFADEIKEARAQYARGEYYTHDEVCKKLGLKNGLENNVQQKVSRRSGKTAKKYISKNNRKD